MPWIVTHPDNLQLLRDHVDRSPPCGLDGIFDLTMKVFGYQVRTDLGVERERPTGRVICPDGTVVDQAFFSYRWDRFTTLEASDLPWLLGLELCKLEMGPVFYLVEDPDWKQYWTLPLQPCLTGHIPIRPLHYDFSPLRYTT